ncbi:MAG: TetR/AcrR family transcriptional regulator [Pseudomonadota bacterium]
MPSSSSQPDSRQRIADAAERIIRADGVERLTMRRLSEEAGVALKTPYNIYGSKTGVLIVLLETAIAPLIADLDQAGDGPKILKLMDILEKTRVTFAPDESFFRGVFWEIMTSDHPEARAAAHGRIVHIVVTQVAKVKDAGEIRDDIVPEVFGGQLGLNLLANMGSWAGGHLSIADAMLHTKAVWTSLIRGVAAPGSLPVVDEIQNAAQLALLALDMP